MAVLSKAKTFQIIAFIIILWCLLPKERDHIEVLNPPIHLAYYVEANKNKPTNTCNLVLVLVGLPEPATLFSNTPEPELLNFRYFVDSSKSVSQKLFGFSANAGVVKNKNAFSKDLHNLGYKDITSPGITKISLINASFESKLFSTKRLNNVSSENDGITMSTSDPKVGKQFLDELIQGNFTINYLRADLGKWRSYNLNSPPSQDVINKFDDCLKAI